eukprot:scaffold14576_cov132-Isochrysis_galbana.AAC.18
MEDQAIEQAERTSRLVQAGPSQAVWENLADVGPALDERSKAWGVAVGFGLVRDIRRAIDIWNLGGRRERAERGTEREARRTVTRRERGGPLRGYYVRNTVARRDRCTERQADDSDWTGIASALIPGTQSNKVT